MSACPALMSCLGGRRPSDGCVAESVAAPPGASSSSLLHEGDAHVCLLSHPRQPSVVSKILASKVLRRWEPHRLALRRDALVALTPCGLLLSPVLYRDVEEVLAVDFAQRHCVRLVLGGEGSLLLHVANRDQWLHSILWKKNLWRSREALSRPLKQEAVLKEVKALVELWQCCPLRDESVTREPLELAASLPPPLDADADALLLEALSPLVEAAPAPPPALCLRMAAACTARRPPPAVVEAAVARVLRRTVDFGRAPPTRLLAERFLLAAPGGFVARLHGAASSCPHPRVLPNLVAVALALGAAGGGDALACCVAVLTEASEYEDWLPGLSQLLRPLPFPEEVLADPQFLRDFAVVVRRIGLDPRCEVHSGVLGLREGKDSWLQLLSADQGELWGRLLRTLLGCCCRRKRFLRALLADPGPCLLRALRDCEAAQEALCLALEWDLPESEDQREQVAATLRSTEEGRRRYAALCLRREHLRELQRKGGPRKLTLPSRATDADVAKLLSCGSFGNLECLSLAFTHVTSACAEQLIKLPSLRYLNLWATQFGDAGLLMICEHLQRLQVLNLCETQVSDEGISALASVTSLRKLNLNSTKLSAQTFQELRRHLPALQEVDVRYTDAW